MNAGAVRPKQPRKKFRRALAGALAVILFCTGALYSATNVSLNAKMLVKNAAVIAAMQLLDNDEYANLGRIGRMSRYMQDYLTVARDYEDYELGAAIAISKENYDDALVCTDQSIACYEGGEEGLGDLYLRKGYLYTLMEEYSDAENWLDRGIALHAAPEARLTRAQVRLSLGDTQGALDDVKSYIDTAENAMELLPNLINIYEATGDFQTAADYYTLLLNDETYRSDDYYLNRAYCYTNLGQMELAEADCERYAAVGGADAATADVMMGIGWMRQSEYARADEAFLSALARGYENPEALNYYIVLCSYISEDYARACEYGDRAVQAILSGEGGQTADLRLEEATGKLKVTLAKTDVSSLCLMTGAAHVQMGNYDSAIDSLTACLKTDGGTVFANYLRGSCLLTAERYEEALADFDAAIAAGEEVEKSTYGRGICRMQLGDREGALEDFDWVMLHGEDKELFDATFQMMERLLRGEPTETE